MKRGKLPPIYNDLSDQGKWQYHYERKTMEIAIILTDTEMDNLTEALNATIAMLNKEKNGHHFTAPYRRLKDKIESIYAASEEAHAAIKSEMDAKSCVDQH